MKVNDETAVEQPKVIPLEKLATLGVAISTSVLAACGGEQSSVGASTDTSTTEANGSVGSAAPNNAAPSFGNSFPQASANQDESEPPLTGQDQTEPPPAGQDQTESPPTGQDQPPPSNNNEPAVSDEAAVRFLLQAQFSASDEEIASVVRQGFANWLDTQLNKAPTTKAWDWLQSRGYDAEESYKTPEPALAVSHLALWNQLIFSPDAVRQRLALALSEYFVISTKALDTFYQHYLAASWWDMLSKESTGNFRQILETVTLHRAMGRFLNTHGNKKEDPKTGRLPDENYAREIMQLFTIGLYQLNIDGTLKLKDGEPKETYTNQDITNLARVFTGYWGGWGGWRSWGTPMKFTEGYHSTLEVNFLNTTIPAGTLGEDALRMALDTLFKHDNVGPFFAKQMIQRLVTSNPSPAYVARVASVFNNNGSGVRGDLKAVWKAILLDSEARSADGLSSDTHGHIREPMVRFIQWARTFGLQSKEGTWKIGDLTSRLGQSPLMADSVFNFFRPGFVPPNTSIAKRVNTRLAPELQIVTEQQVADYLNTMREFIDHGIPVDNPDDPNPRSKLRTTSYDITARYTKELALAADASQLVDRIILLLTANQLSRATRDQIIRAVNSVAIPATSSVDARRLLLRKRVVIAVFLVMASPQYIVQK